LQAAETGWLVLLGCEPVAAHDRAGHQRDRKPPPWWRRQHGLDQGPQLVGHEVVSKGGHGAGFCQTYPTGAKRRLSHHAGRPSSTATPRASSNYAVRLEHGVDVAGRSASVVGQRHRRAPENVDVGDDASPEQPITEPAEGIFYRTTVEQWLRLGHATSNSWLETNTPRRRNAAGAWTIASTRAARELKGNQKRSSRRDSLRGGAPRPSRAARCSANAARRTSQRGVTCAGRLCGQQSVAALHRFPSVFLKELGDQSPPL
jgi:hypothetical protein